MFAARRIQELRFISMTAALVLALVGGSWPLFALLLLTWIPSSWMRGYTVVDLLLCAVACVAGVALDSTAVAILGGLAPFAATVVLRGVVPRIFGTPTSLVRDPFFGLESTEEDISVLTRKLGQWQTRIRAAPADPSVMELVLLEMRDWNVTPSQATRVATFEGSPRELVERISKSKVYWPERTDDAFVDVGWQWERVIQASHAPVPHDR